MSALKVLFVGSEFNPLSIGVLGALASAEDLEVTVLASQPHRRGLLATARRTWASHGLGTLWRGGWRLVRARLRMAGRALGLRPEGAASLTEVAHVRRLRVVPATRINARATREAITALAPDLLLVSALDQILKAPVLAIPRLGCVNVHPSLLPAYRGPNPFYWVLANGEARTGVSLHMIDEGIDTGDLLLQEELEIRPGETEHSLQRRATELAGRMALEAVRGLGAGTLSPKPQPEEGASYHPQPPRGASRL